MLKQSFKKIISQILIWQSKKVLAKYRPRIVAITGSVGKTSTKDLVAHVLGKKFHVRKSEKSFNSEIGLPLTILGLSNAWLNPFAWTVNIVRGFSLIFFPHSYPELLVLEVGADRPGDIKKVAAWLRPEVVIITRIGTLPVHVEFFPSPEALAQEKAALALALGKEETLILNHDDDVVRAIGAKSLAHVVTYGFSDAANVQARNDHLVYENPEASGELSAPKGEAFTLLYQGKLLPVVLPNAVGKQVVSSALAGFAAGVAFGVPLLEIVEQLGTFMGPPGRMKLLTGIKKTIVIDDTYNSSPVALEAALELLNSLSVPGRKIAVLGDMMELGKYTVEAHKAAGFQVARATDVLFTVGTRARFIADGAMAEGMKEQKIKQFDDSHAAGIALDDFLKKGDAVLVKGSQYVRMERVVLEVMAEPERAPEFLVRQEKEWEWR
jgi:UDP-N-acetylmuramoyl-tripeptide--D-alanyl-D-alanine ligase